MSRVVGSDLTAALLERLAGAHIEQHEGKIIPLVTVDEAGWPNPALLSYYEIVAKSAAALEMALWKNSSTANHLRRSGKVTLMVIDRGVNYYLKGTVRELEHEMAGAPQVSRFGVALEQVIEDQEANAEITTALTYKRLTARDPTDFAAKVFRLLRGQ